MIHLEEFSAGIGGGDIIIASSGKTNNMTLSKSLSYFLLFFGWLWRIFNTIMDPTMMDIHTATCHTCVHMYSLQGMAQLQAKQTHFTITILNNLTCTDSESLSFVCCCIYVSPSIICLWDTVLGPKIVCRNWSSSTKFIQLRSCVVLVYLF